MKSLIHPFKSSLSGVPIPQEFSYPFHVQPEPLTELAVQELQDFLQANPQWFDHIGSQGALEQESVGKMFGVLVVRTPQGELAHLWAYSGKLQDAHDPPQFVPPLADLQDPQGFYRRGEAEVLQLTHQIQAIQADPQYVQLQTQLQSQEALSRSESLEAKRALKQAKQERRELRARLLATLSEEDFKQRDKELNQESSEQQLQFKWLKKNWNQTLTSIRTQLQEYSQQLQELQTQRQELSQRLQDQIFEQYQFHNAKAQVQGLKECFKNEPHPVPPTGSGDCSAPKLLEFAYQHQLQPVSMLEFWWGTSTPSEMRIHAKTYPACKGKCRPILNFMLQGLEVAPNLIHAAPTPQGLDIIMEDEHIIILNKPAGLLSVPGREVQDSLQVRVQAYLGLESSDHLIVHRLDMATSGLLICTKTPQAHKHLQAQFLDKSISKKYIALLQEPITETSGEIQLPLILDWEHRPLQKVCHQTGKAAHTRWQRDPQDPHRIHLYPITGRTHQLRVHMASSEGLANPIQGDRLYGQPGERLHLHAERVEFKHPATGALTQIHSPAPF